MKVPEWPLLSDTRAGQHSILEFREQAHEWCCKVGKSLHVAAHAGKEVNRVANVTYRTVGIAVHVHLCILAGMGTS